jgi:Flp pilus assembly pilin Flp
MLAGFRRSDYGQDLADYCLLTALIALIALGIFCHVAGGIQGMWSTAGTTLATANTTNGANSSTTGASDSTTTRPAGQ